MCLHGGPICGEVDLAESGRDLAKLGSWPAESSDCDELCLMLVLLCSNTGNMWGPRTSRQQDDDRPQLFEQICIHRTNLQLANNTSRKLDVVQNEKVLRFRVF